VTAAYVIAETFGFEKGIRHRPKDAPIFVGVITVLIVIGTIVAMAPGVPVIKLLVAVQAVNGVLLPITLFFVWRLSASAGVMGTYRNGRVFNVLAGATVVVTSVLSLTLLVITAAGL
jgi:Mn2+/Fe2+ NRAMP family transporter